MNSQERVLNRRFVRFSCPLVRERGPNCLRSLGGLYTLLAESESTLLLPDAAIVLELVLGPFVPSRHRVAFVSDIFNLVSSAQKSARARAGSRLARHLRPPPDQ
jgi:hypothetical protein